ncbi:hypothetical protein [Candidatus Phytoplasma solani]|uniref:hypothetical protein n=1 Tax=Candidatus Phytoplasma solani TaxID=69896 RepID=UPI00358EB1B7
MNLILQIKISPSDVSSEKRFWYKEENKTTSSYNKTGSFYINDNQIKYMKIISWFNSDNKKNGFAIDIQSTKNYIDDIKKYIFSNINNFQFHKETKFITLEEYEKKAQNFLQLTTKNQEMLNIEPIILSGKGKDILTLGKSKRYLKFDESNCKKSECFSDLFFNKTEIDISLVAKQKQGGIFIISPRLLANFRRN